MVLAADRANPVRRPPGGAADRTERLFEGQQEHSAESVTAFTSVVCRRGSSMSDAPGSDHEDLEDVRRRVVDVRCRGLDQSRCEPRLHELAEFTTPCKEARALPDGAEEVVGVGCPFRERVSLGDETLCERGEAVDGALALSSLEDPRSPLKRLPFGMRGFRGPSIEAFHRRGLLEQIASQRRDGASGLPRPGPVASGPELRGPAGHFAGIQVDYSNIDSSRWTYRLSGAGDTQLGSEMEHIERVLAAHALSVGVEIQRGHGVSGFEASDDEVTVRAGERRSRARWLAGCDGGRSTVRKQGGFEFERTEPELTGSFIHRWADKA